MQAGPVRAIWVLTQITVRVGPTIFMVRSTWAAKTGGLKTSLARRRKQLVQSGA
ncbi:hypothetical protein [Kribbella sp. NPDC023855]|uniref:hypothetical protein n=1 Tax=Kribbella sp. NPDC023855 TaxID=3154698 RepID=UPI0033CA2507